MSRLSTLLKNDHVKAITLAAIAMVGLSFLRAWVAGTLKVDGYNLTGQLELFTVITFIAALGVFSFSYYKLWDQGSLDITSIKLLAYILAFVFSFMLPMLSNDIFSFIAYGDASNKGFDVYTNTNCLQSSAYFSYVSSLWNKAPCVYGPVCLPQAKLAAWIGHGNYAIAIIACKVFYLVWVVIFIEMGEKISKLLATPPRLLLFVLLNPLWLIQGVGQLHCDGIAVTLTLCTLYFFLSGRWYLAFVFLALCIATKISYVLVLPFLIIGLLLQKEGWPTFLRRSIIGVLITAAVFALLYYPVYTSPDTFLVMFRFIIDRNPCKSLAEIFGDIFYFVPKVLFQHNGHASSDYIHNASGIPDQLILIWNILKRVFQAIALITSGYILFRFWRSKGSLQQWFRVYVRLLLLFLLFYSHVFYDWYLIMFLPFMWVEDDKGFMKWLFVLTCLVNVQDVVCVTDRGSTAYTIVVVLTGLSVIWYLWRFRKVYVKSLGY